MSDSIDDRLAFEEYEKHFPPEPLTEEEKEAMERDLPPPNPSFSEAELELEELTRKNYETRGKLSEAQEQLEKERQKKRELEKDNKHLLHKVKDLEKWKYIDGKKPPQAVPDEEMLLSIFLQQPEKQRQIRGKHTKHWFYKEHNQRIYSAISVLKGNTTPETVIDYLKKKDRLEEVGGPHNIHRLTGLAKTRDIKNFKYHKENVWSAYIQRDLIRQCENIKNKMFNDEEILPYSNEQNLEDELSPGLARSTKKRWDKEGNPITQNRTSSMIHQIKTIANNFMHLVPYENRINFDFGTIVDDAFERLGDTIKREGKPRISTYINEMDRLTHGILPARFGIITAQGKVGKTTYATTLADNVMDQGFDVAYFTFESKPYEIIFKLAARRAGIDLEKFEYFEKDYKDFTKEEQEQVWAQKDNIKKLPFHLEGGEADPDYVIGRSKYLKMMHPNLSAVIIDGIQSFSDTVPKGMTKADYYYNLMNVFSKRIGERLGVQVIVNGQFQRLTGKKIPQHMDQISDCKGLGEVADWAIALYQPSDVKTIKAKALAKRQGEPSSKPFDLKDDRKYGAITEYQREKA
ncbi:hypothetical protein KY327_03015 [Candidatus Woesearchaeota archaeon]|nr:hypothetical protein [Candidatus Woesearchaeota archaeon]